MDSIRKLSLTLNSAKFDYVEDRFGVSNSAAYINDGYLQLPTAIYFYREFYFTAWVFPQEDNSNSNKMILCCGIDEVNPEDNAVFIAVTVMQKDPWFTIYESGSKNNKYLGTAFNWPNAWTHYAVIVGSDIGSMYLNGTQSTPSVAQNPIKVTDRKMCYFGNWILNIIDENPVSPVNAKIDDVVIFKKSLSQAEILKVMEFN